MFSNMYCILPKRRAREGPMMWNLELDHTLDLTEKLHSGDFWRELYKNSHFADSQRASAGGLDKHSL